MVTGQPLAGVVSLGQSTVYCFIVVQSWPGLLFIAHVWESECRGGGVRGPQAQGHSGVTL